MPFRHPFLPFGGAPFAVQGIFGIGLLQLADYRVSGRQFHAFQMFADQFGPFIQLLQLVPDSPRDMDGHREIDKEQRPQPSRQKGRKPQTAAGPNK